MADPTSSQPLPPSVVELDGPFTHEFVHTRGLRLHAAVAGDPADPLIVLLHGAFGGWFDYRHVIAPLAQAGYHVAAVDLRGYGMSDKPPTPQSSNLRMLASDVAGVIPALGHDDAVVVGADTGGTVAWSLAVTHPERVAALVSVSSAHPVDLRRAVAARPWNFLWILARAAFFRLPSRLWASSRRLRDRGHEFHLRLNTTAQFQQSPRFTEELELRRRAAAISNAAVSAVHNARVLLAAAPLAWVSAKVPSATLLVHPDQGLWTHVVRRSRARVAGRVAQARVPGAKTEPHVENPQGFVDTLLEFLRTEA